MPAVARVSVVIVGMVFVAMVIIGDLSKRPRQWPCRLLDISSSPEDFGNAEALGEERAADAARPVVSVARIHDARQGLELVEWRRRGQRPFEGRRTLAPRIVARPSPCGRSA